MDGISRMIKDSGVRVFIMPLWMFCHGKPTCDTLLEILRPYWYTYYIKNTFLYQNRYSVGIYLLLEGS